MPQSRTRHKHPVHSASGGPPRRADSPRKNAAPIMAIFVGLIATGITLLSGAALSTIAIAAGIGVVIGFFIGRSLDKNVRK